MPRRRRRGRTIAAATATVALLGVAGVAAAGFGGDGGGAAPAAQLPPATAQVAKQDLRDTQTVDGDLGYGLATSLVNRGPGTITWLPASGDVITRGKALYAVDQRPVTLFYGATPAYRHLGPGDEGADVKQLETNLKALGYGGFTVDDEYTSDTADAVKEWQEDLGLDETGRVELGRVIFAADAVRVDAVKAELGQPVQPGQTVLTHTGTTRLVTVRLEVADQRLAKTGAEVKVELPGGASVAGKVDKAYTVIEPATGQGTEPETRIEAIVSLADPKAADGLDAASVDVVFTLSEHKQVLTVPVSALVALAEGGYGVEIVEGAASRYVRVETGLYSGGRVEIKGEGIVEGTTVGVPK